MSASIESLKQSLRQLAPTALVAPAYSENRPTGLAALDAKLEAGGLPLGTITEIAGAASSGKTAIALSIAAALTKREHGRNLCGFIDGRSELYPPAAAALGVDLTRLLWVRPGSKITAVARATEILIRSRAFALLIVDIPHGARLTRVVAQRLRTSSSQTSTSIIVLCDRAGDVDQAQTRLQTSQHRGQTSILIHKGSASGPASVALHFERRHANDRGSAPIAPAIERVSPGTEPRGARIPPTPAFSPMPQYQGRGGLGEATPSPQYQGRGPSPQYQGRGGLGEATPSPQYQGRGGLGEATPSPQYQGRGGLGEATFSSQYQGAI